MKPGTKPKPLALKKLEGDIHKERWNLNEPKPVSSRPTMPSFLSGSAKYEWRRIVPELETLGLLFQIDRAALAAYCQSYGRWADAEKELNKLSEMGRKQIRFLYKTTNDNLVINPLLSVANKAMEQMKSFLVEFGMTPSSRSRVNASGGGGDDRDPMDKLLNSKRLN
jgi:P27 family predicted phage terminase small subunit